MANRTEIIEDLVLLADRDKVNAYVANLDRQAELARNLNLNSKENEVTEVAEVVQEEATPELIEDVAKALIPMLAKMKALEDRVKALESGTVKAIGDSPKVSLEELVAKYLNGENTEKANVGQPNVAQFGTPAIAKGHQPTDIFGALDSGRYDKKAAQ